MTNRQLIVAGVVVFAVVGGYLYWQKHKTTVVSPQPANNNNNNSNSNAVSQAVDSLQEAWAGLENLWT